MKTFRQFLKQLFCKHKWDDWIIKFAFDFSDVSKTIQMATGLHAVCGKKCLRCRKEKQVPEEIVEKELSILRLGSKERIEAEYLQQPRPFKVGDIVIVNKKDRWEIVEFKDKGGIVLRRPNFYKNESMRAYPYEYKTFFDGRIELVTD